MGLVVQHGADVRALRVEVRTPPCPYTGACLLTCAPSNSWDLHVTSSAHRIKLYSVNKTKPATAARLAQFAARGESIAPLTKPSEAPLEDMTAFVEAMRKYPREPRTEN